MYKEILSKNDNRYWLVVIALGTSTTFWEKKFYSSPFPDLKLSEVKIKNVSHPDEEVDHEENIECQVDLLGCVLRPGDAGLNCVAKIKQN